MRRTFSRLRSNGFSLVEFLMAALIMGIGLLGLASLQVMALRTAGNGKMLMTSIGVANSILEAASSESRNLYLGRLYPQSAPSSYTQLLSGAVPTLTFDTSGQQVGAGTPTAFYTANISSVPEAATGSANQYLMTVTVTYNEQANPSSPGSFIQRSVTVQRRFVN